MAVQVRSSNANKIIKMNFSKLLEMTYFLKVVVFTFLVLECSSLVETPHEPKAFKTSMPAGRLSLYMTIAVLGAAILALILSCICWKLNLCCTRPLGMSRVCWMRMVGLLSFCSIVFTILSCFGMSTIPSELASLGWIRSHTMVGGIFAFARINATIPPNIVKKYENDTIVYRAGFHEVELFGEIGVMTTWGRCATAQAGSFEDDADDGVDGASRRFLLRGTRREDVVEKVDDADDDAYDDDDITPTYELPEDLQEEVDKKKVDTEEPTSRPVPAPTMQPTPMPTFEPTPWPTVQPYPNPTRTDPVPRPTAAPQSAKDHQTTQKPTPYPSPNPAEHTGITVSTGTSSSSDTSTGRSDAHYHDPRVGGGVYQDQFFRGCKRCRELSSYAATMQILSVGFIIPMLALNYARSETFADGKCVKVFSVAMALWGMFFQFGSLLLFDFGCTVWLLPRVWRGGGYWCAYVSAFIRFIIAVMNAVLAYPTEREVDRETDRQEEKAIREQPYKNTHAYKPLAKSGSQVRRIKSHHHYHRDRKVENDFYAPDENHNFYDIDLDEEEEEDNDESSSQDNNSDDDNEEEYDEGNNGEGEKRVDSNDNTLEGSRQRRRPHPVRKGSSPKPWRNNSPKPTRKNNKKGAARVSRSATGRVEADDDSTDLGYLMHHHAANKDSHISDDNFLKFAGQIGDESDVSMSSASQGPGDVRKVRVDILSASNLENKDMFGKSDPYVRCEWEDKKIYKTRVIKDSCDPEWIGEEFVLSIGPAQANSVLLLECFDSDVGFNTKGDFLGRCDLTGSELLEHGLKGELVELPLGPNKAHNRVLRLRASIINKVQYPEAAHEVAAEPEEVEEASTGPSTSSKLFSMFSSKKSKDKKKKKKAEEEKAKRSANSAESVLQPLENRKEDLLQAEKSRGGRSSSTPRQDHYKKNQEEESDDDKNFADGFDEDTSLAGVEGDEEELTHNAWGKVLDFLHENGDSQVDVGGRIIEVWRKAEGCQKVKRVQQTVKMDIRDKMGLEMGHTTLRVMKVTPGGQGEKKKVRPGWICRKVDIVHVASMSELMTALAHQKTLGNTKVDMTFEVETFITKKETDNEWRFAGMQQNRGVGKSSDSNVVDMASLVEAFAKVLTDTKMPFTDKEEKAWWNDLSDNQEWLTISLAEFTAAANTAEDEEEGSYS